MEIVPFQSEHYDMMDFREEEIHRINVYGGDDHMKAVVDQVAEYHIANTFLSDGVPAAIFGIMKKWDGVYEIFALTGIQVESRPLSFMKACIRGLDSFYEIMREDGEEAHRVEACVRDSHMKSFKWLLHLGFRAEGIMRKYGPDKSDHYLLARV